VFKCNTAGGGCAREGTCDGHWSSPWRSRTRRKSQLRSSLIVRPRSCNGLSVRVPADHGRMVIRQELPRSGRSCRSAGFGRSCTEAAIHGALGFGWVRGVLPFALRVAAPRSTAARPPGWHASGIAICYRHVESHHRLGQSFQDECVDLVSRRHRAFQVEGRREWRVNRGARATDRIRQIGELRREGLSLRSIAARIRGAVSHVTVKGILSNADAESENEPLR